MTKEEQDLMDTYRTIAIDANKHTVRLMQEIAQLKARGVTVTAVDDLKVDFTDYIAQSALGEMVLSLGEKHNALVEMEGDDSYRSVPPKHAGYITGVFVKVQPPPVDLESVRRLIEATKDYTKPIRDYAIEALPALKVLLAEVTQSRSTIALLEAQVTSLAEKVGDLAMERAEMKVEIKRLREENAKLKEGSDEADRQARR